MSFSVPDDAERDEHATGPPSPGAREIFAAQNRLRFLLSTHAVVTEGPGLAGVLSDVVEAAQARAGTGYAVLQVTGGTGLVEEFVGPDPDPGDDRPDFGVLSGYPGPRHRGPDTAGDRRSFVGVPIRARGEVCGALYLISSGIREFDAEDERLVAELAATAGAAVENAWRHRDSARARPPSPAGAPRRLFPGETPPRSGPRDTVEVPMTDRELRLLDAAVAAVGDALRTLVVELGTAMAGDEAEDTPA